MRGGASVRLCRDQRGRPDAGPVELLAGSRGTVIVARRLTGAELRWFERERGHSDAAVPGAIVNREGRGFGALGAAARANVDATGRR